MMRLDFPAQFQVGIGFTRQSLRTVGRALPLALLVIVGLVLACAGLGTVLVATFPLSREKTEATA